MTGWQHGTRTGYSNHRCRCRPCTDAIAAYKREQRAKKRDTSRPKATTSERSYAAAAKRPRGFGVSDLPLPQRGGERGFEREEGRHYHTWRLPEPNGPTCVAACTACGAEKRMHNVYVVDRPQGRGWLGVGAARIGGTA